MAGIDRDKLDERINDRLTRDYGEGKSESLISVSVGKYRGLWHADTMDVASGSTFRVELPWDDKELRHTATLNGFTMEEELYISFMSVLRGVAGYRR